MNLVVFSSTTLPSDWSILGCDVCDTGDVINFAAFSPTTLPSDWSILGCDVDDAVDVVIFTSFSPSTLPPSWSILASEGDGTGDVMTSTTFQESVDVDGGSWFIFISWVSCGILKAETLSLGSKSPIKSHSLSFSPFSFPPFLVSFVGFGVVGAVFSGRVRALVAFAECFLTSGTCFSIQGKDPWDTFSHVG